MVSLLGLHPIWNTSSAWLSNTCSRWLRLRQSCSATCSGARFRFLHQGYGTYCEERTLEMLA